MPRDFLAGLVFGEICAVRDVVGRDGEEETEARS